MDIYHIWCDLGENVSDLEFTDAALAYFEHLKASGHLSAYRITRRKLGLGPAHLPEFHLMLEFDGLARLDEAFLDVAARCPPLECLHHGINAKVRNVSFALYRDFPDPGRIRGQERF